MTYIGEYMKDRLIVKLLAIDFMFFIIGYMILRYMNIEREKTIENMIQIMILIVAGSAFYTWYVDNKRSNVELVFLFDKRWDELIKIIGDECDEASAKVKQNLADNNNNKLLYRLEEPQERLKFFLEKIEYYGNKHVEKSYIDIVSIVKKIGKSVELLIDIVDIDSNEKAKVLNLYKHNLAHLKSYIEETKIYKNPGIMCDQIDTIIEIIDNNNNNNSDDSNLGGSENIIGKAVGNDRYFNSTDKSNILFTSRNWNEEDTEKYTTWYAIPKEGDRSWDTEKNFYFIVREKNEKDEYPYLYISNNELIKLIEKIEAKDNMKKNDKYIHFYFTWYKKYDNNEEVYDARNQIRLGDKTYKLGGAKLEKGKLYITL